MALVGKGSRGASAARVTWVTAENVNHALANKTDNIILGCGVGDDNGDRIKANDTGRLQWRIAGGTFADLSATGAVKFGLTDLVNSNTLTAAERLSTGLFGSYTEGEEVEGTATGSHSQQIRDRTTEFQWSLSFADAADNTTYDFQVIWTWDGGGGSTTLPYISILTPVGGATYFLGMKVQGEGDLALTDIGLHPLRVRKGGVTYGLELVPTGDLNASRIRVRHGGTTLAIRKFT